MRRIGLLGTTALRSVAVLGIATTFTSAALAQEVTNAQDTQRTGESDPAATLQSEVEVESGQDAQENDTAGQAIVVTGSRIRRPNLDSPVPVTSVGGEEFFETGQVSVGDVLNELPALRSTFSQSNSTRFLGTAGLNLLDLRGLGTQRTLVLVNGRRHVAGDILNNAVSTDVNTIPTDLIERVDIVTGGNSAIYGSDAIAGVANFILRQNYEGIQIRAQGGISQYGDAGSYYASLLAGQNFGGDRGNIAINLEYARQNEFFAGGRPNLRTTSGFLVVDTDPGGAPSDGNPDRIFFEDIRNALYSNAGTFISCCTTLAGGTAGVPYIFQPDGTLVLQTGTRVGRGFFGSFVGGNGNNFREGDQLGLTPNQDRYAANVIGHFTVSEAFEPFFEAKYVRTDTLGSASGPFFTASTGSPREFFLTSNPYLSQQAAGIIRDYYGAGPDDDVGFLFFRNVLDLGSRQERSRRETYRIVAGARGDLGGNWNYEVSGNYGRFKEATEVLGNVNIQRYLLAIDAVRDPATGNIVCRSRLDPTTGAAYEFPTAGFESFAQSQLAQDIAQCVPVNLFGQGNVTDAARNYIVQDTTSVGRISQLVFNAFVSGDTSQWFELPGGPIGIAAGLEYRRDTASFEADQIVAAGLTFYNALQPFDPPAQTVKEAFAEIRIPILSEVPFFHALTATAAGRVSNYSQGQTGTVYAYNGGLEWSPVRDIRFRANYSRAVRAPNLVELFSPLGQNFAPGFVDPCAAANIGTGSANRLENCRAEGLDVDGDDAFDFIYQSSLGILSGGNPDLREETSDSYTLGAVITPQFIPGLSLSVDYYDIKVNNVITAPTAQQIADACYDAADLDNQFCDLFDRYTGTTEGPRGEVPGQILEGNLRQVLLNYAALRVRGIDFEAAFRRNLETIGTLDTRFTYTHVLQNDQFLDPTDPGFANQFLLELGDPQDAFNWRVSLESGPITFGYQLRYIGKMVLNQYEDFFEKQGRPPQNADYADRRFYPSVTYHDLRLGIEAGRDFDFYMGVDNVTNRNPPLGLTGAGGGSGIYTNRGRFFYAGAVARF